MLNYLAKSRRVSRVGPSGRSNGAPHDRPAFGSDDWMQEQQVRSEKEAESWRLLREELRAATLAVAHPNAPVDYHRSGSATLKALVRFGLATLGAHVAWLVAVAFQLGQFETWLAMVAGFAIALALSMLRGARGVVHLLAEAAGWMIVSAVALSGVWLAFQFLG